MGLNLNKLVVDFLMQNPDTEHSAREIAEWIFQNHRADCEEKRQRSSQDLTSDADLVRQIIAEIAANRPAIERRDSHIKTAGTNPIRYFYKTLPKGVVVQPPEIPPSKVVEGGGAGIPKVDRQAILQALQDFDSTLRNSQQWAEWENNKAQVWALEEGQNRYPPKKIISMATGMSVSDFTGGPETNKYLAERGFTVSRLRETTLDETFRLILDLYHNARSTQAFGGNHEIKELFSDARRIVEESTPVKNNPNLRVVASYGKGNWATIPWISILDKRETETTQAGTYVVYLFREDGQGAYLKLAQGVTAAQKELGARAPAVLAERAAEIRVHCSELTNFGFDLSGHSDLGVDQKLAKLYEASTIAAKYYPKDAMPSESALIEDIGELLKSYDAYVVSRGNDTVPIKDERPIAIIGTARTITEDAAEMMAAIASTGACASWWSFPIRDEAKERLKTPFNLYAYIGEGRLGARLTVAEYVTSKGSTGIESPWPEITKSEWVGKTRNSDKGSEIFKTWFKIVAIKVFNPPLPLDQFEIALGLSTPSNLLNQASFGYLLDEATDNPEPPIALPPIVPLALEIDWLMERTGLRKEFLQEMVASILGDSPQIMLAGPPGTSKTWVARHLATYLARGRDDNIRFVQFHPSYSYESFLEGLRPVTRSNGVSFEVTPGVVREHVSLMQKAGAVDQVGNEYVIVIDEANRANLPRVLGELMFLFEYRSEPIRLQYSADFRLPKNLRFIATMNTADRSIRSIDVALRRRFDVFEFNPDPEILAKHYSDGRPMISGLVDGLTALNEALTAQLDRHHTIGHTFFMRDWLDAAVLRQIWSRRVFPLIEEFFFDQPDLAKQFTVDRFWPAVNG